MKIAYIFFQFTYSLMIYSQNDTIKRDTIPLKEVILISESKIKIKQDNGKYIANVSNTDFQQTQNTWEGLKLIPMLKINDNENLKVNSKNAIIEVNGIQVQLSGFELESYLKSLNPNIVKKIEIILNPNASYGSNVDAIINIILDQNSNNYRLGTNSTNGTRRKYFNSSNINLNYNLEKLKIYTSYSFNYNQKINESEIISQIEGNPILKFDYNEDTYQKNHQYYLNVNFGIDKKNNLDITTVGSFENYSREGLGINAKFERVLETNSKNKKNQFAEIFKHSFNDSTFLKIGVYQVFNSNKSTDLAKTNTTNFENQEVISKIPLLVGFGDFSKSTLIGNINTGTRFNFTTIKKDNFLINTNSENNNPYSYNEKIISTYINNSLELTEKSSLSIGLRLESSYIDYKFSDSNYMILFEDNLKYSNLLYSVNYMFLSKKEWHHSLAIRKQIQRPNYSYLNPFLKINSDITYNSGDIKITPSKLYLLNYDFFKKNWFSYVQTGFVNHFISTFTDQIGDKIVETYKNFDKVLLTGFGLEYNPTLIKNIWYSRINFDVTYFKITDKNYPHIGQSSLNSKIEVNNVFKIKNHQLNLKYNLTPTYKDGLLKHFRTQRLDFTISKKINTNFSLFFYAYDFLKTNINWEDTTLINYFYGSKNYNDQRAFGLSLRWNITGKTYKKNEIEKIQDNSIDRL